MPETRIDSQDFLSQLNDEIVTDYTADDDNITTIVTALLAFQVHGTPITIGTIEPTVSRSMYVEQDMLLPVLLRLRDTVGGYIEGDSDRQLNWWNDLGEDTGQQIPYRKNLKGITRSRDFFYFSNRLYCYGEGEGDARITLSDVSSLLSGNAASGQPDVAVADGSLFEAGLIVTISDDNDSEEKTIDSILGNTLTMTVNLTNAYTTAANGAVNRGLD